MSLEEKIEGIKISKTYMSGRLYYCLKRAGFIYIKDVLNADVNELMKYRGIGPKLIAEIEYLRNFIENTDRENIDK